MKYVLAFLLCLVISPAGAQNYCCSVGVFTPQASPYTAEVATRAYVPDAGDTTNRQIMSRAMMYVRAAANGVQFIIPNLYVTTGGDETGNGGNVGVYASAATAASLEYPIGTCTQAKFSGSTSGIFATGQATLATDLITSNLPNGALIGVRIRWVGSQGAVYEGTTQEDTTLGDAMTIGVSGVADQTVSCDTVTNTNAGQYLAPLAVIGSITGPSVCITGDSIAIGVHTVNTSLGDLGTVAPSIGPTIPYINLARSSESAQVYLVQNAVRSSLYPYCSHQIDELGINDIINGRTLVQLEADTETIISEFSLATSGGPTWITTLTPYTSGASLAAQSPVSATETTRTQFNTDSRNLTLTNSGYFDVNSSVGNSTNDSLWNQGAGFPACNPWPFETVAPWLHPTTCADNQVFTSGVVNPAQIHRP